MVGAAEASTLSAYESLTVSGVADLLGVHTTTIERWLRSGELPGAKFGGRWAVPADGVDRWLRGRQIAGVRVGLQCRACAFGVLGVNPAAPPERRTCSAACGNHITAADLLRLRLVCRVAGAGRVEQALRVLERWGADARREGRDWEPMLVEDVTPADEWVGASSGQGGPEADPEAARRAAYALFARMWGPEDSVYDSWDPQEDVSL